MRILRTVMLCLFLPAWLFAQTGSQFVLKRRFDFDNPAEKLVTFRLLEDDKLWLLGTRSVQIWDVGGRSVISNKKHGIDELNEYSLQHVSPDGTRLFYGSRKYGEAGSFVSAFVFDLKALKQIRTFDAKALRTAYWSDDGRTFVSINDGVKTEKDGPKNFQVSFWDGDTLELRKTIIVPDLDWWHLTPDGTLFYTTSVPTAKWLGILPNEMADKATTITVWNAAKGQIEKTLSVGDKDYSVLTWKLTPSPSGRYMAVVSKHKSDNEENKILFWELNGSETPKYSIKANPKISDSNIRYSPDERFFAVDVGKDIQIFNAETGEKTGDVQNINLPDNWLPGDDIVFSTLLNKMRAYSVSSGKILFENPLVYESYDNTTTDSDGNTTTTDTVVVDHTVVRPNPNGKVYLTYSNEYLKVFRADTGELIETLVRPPLMLTKGERKEETRRQLRFGKPVGEAGWSDDGRTFWMIEGNRTAITLWDYRGTE
jgi:WD40 repeat protein